MLIKYRKNKFKSQENLLESDDEKFKNNNKKRNKSDNKIKDIQNSTQ
jgi:hypothetical protein